MPRSSTVAAVCAMLAAASVVSCGHAVADDKGPSLSQQLANPIANLTSVPIQYNFLFDTDRRKKGTVSVLDVQPVIPIRLNGDWNLITRTILPIAATNNILGGLGDARGLGDTQMSLFLSPERTGPGGLIWGLGTAINIPTATDPLLGTRKWGAGPTAVALVQTQSWTIGVLANQMWSFNGTDINKSFIQPWATYQLNDGWSISATSQTSYNWTTGKWTVPINVGVAKLFNVGKQPVQFQVGGIYNLTAPSGVPRWGLQATLTFLFPKDG